MAVVSEIQFNNKDATKYNGSTLKELYSSGKFGLPQGTYNFAKQNIVNGTNNVVCEGAVDEPLINAQIYGNSIQDITPTPELPIEIESVGEKTYNLFDVNNANVFNGYIGETSLQAYSTPVNTTCTFAIKIKPNTTYTVTREIIGARFRIATSPSEPIANAPFTSVVTNYTSNFLTITSGENDYYLYVWFYHSSYDNYTYQELMSKIQVLEGRTIKEWQPYGYRIPVKVINSTEEITTNIYLKEPLRKIGDYADYIDFENQKVIRNIKYLELDKNKNWSKYTSIGNHYQVPVGDNYFSTTENYIFSNYYIENKVNNAYYSTLDYAVMSADGSRIRFKNKDISTLEEWKNWLSSLKEKLYVIYRLATPTEETIDIPEIMLADGNLVVDIDTTINPSNTIVTYWKQK